MTTENPNQELDNIQLLLDVFLTMDERPGNWDLTTDEDETFTTDEEEDLERDLAEIALETTRRNYTFTRVIPTKKLFQKCHQPQVF
jgi:hypothetical protein